MATTAVEKAGTLSASGTTASVSLTLPVYSVTLRARVFAADGATPIPSTYVELWTSTGSYLTYAYTDAQGVALFNQVLMPAGGVRVIAYYQRYPDYVTTDTPVAITGSGNLQVDSIMPLSVVKGRVTFSDGSPVPYPSVFVQSPGEIFDDGEGGSGAIARYSQLSDANGNYLVLGPPVGLIKVVAQDEDSGTGRRDRSSDNRTGGAGHRRCAIADDWRGQGSRAECAGCGDAGHLRGAAGRGCRVRSRQLHQ